MPESPSLQSWKPRSAPRYLPPSDQSSSVEADRCPRCAHPWHGLACSSRWHDRVLDVPFPGFTPATTNACPCPSPYDEESLAS